MLVHVVLCREHVKVSTTASHKHVYHTSSSTGLATLGLIYNTGIDTGILHTYPPKHMHVPLGIHRWATGQTQSTKRSWKLYHKLECTVCVYRQTYFISYHHLKTSNLSLFQREARVLSINDIQLRQNAPKREDSSLYSLKDIHTLQISEPCSQSTNIETQK